MTMTELKSKSNLLLVNGNSLLYRSFFAMPRLTNREGLPTHAVYGFATVLRKLLTEEKPDLVAVVFDAPGKTFRHDIYREYKANRPETPDDLVAQAPYARKLCEVLGLFVLSVEGVEADDVIGTLATQAEGEGYHVYIVSSDKDFLQLVSDRLTVLHPGRDLRYDPKAVEKKFGVPPEKVVDVLALMGDSVNNVPGVPGIGEKGAISLIQKWGSVESSLENAERVKNKRQREGLTQYADQAKLSKNLVRIVTDVEVDVELEQLAYKGPDREAALELFEKLEFTTLLKDYLPEEAEETPATYRPIDTAENLGRVLSAAKSNNRLAIHLLQEADAPLAAPLRGLGLAVEPGEGHFAPVGGKLNEGELFDRLGPYLTDESLPKVGHDLKHAWRVLAERGIELAGIGFDTMIASYVLNPGKRSHGLDALAMEFLQKELSSPEDDGVEQKALPGMGGPPTVGRSPSGGGAGRGRGPTPRSAGAQDR